MFSSAKQNSHFRSNKVSSCSSAVRLEPSLESTLRREISNPKNLISCECDVEEGIQIVLNDLVSSVCGEEVPVAVDFVTDRLLGLVDMKRSKCINLSRRLKGLGGTYDIVELCITDFQNRR